MTPTVIQRLRCTLRDLWHYDGCGCNTCVPVAEVIAAVERELAAKDAEIAELRKRPTLDEVRKALEQCRTPVGRGDLERGAEPYEAEISFNDALRQVQALYGTARAEAPK